MTPADLRDLTWESLQPRLTGQRLAVLAAFRERGPATTEQMAAKIGMSILTFRPRTTELCQLGLVYLVDRDHSQGIYAAVPPAEARAAFEAARAAATPTAHQLALI